MRIRTDLEPDFVQVLKKAQKQGTTVELRSPNGERLLGGEAWISWVETAGSRLECVINLGKRPQLGPAAAYLSKHERDERNAKILALYAEGKTQEQIRDILGCSRDTVQTVIRKSPFGDRQRESMEAEVLRRHQAGQSQETIRRALSMSRTWVGNIIRAHE